MRLAISGISLLLLNMGAAGAVPKDTTIDHLLDVCEAPTVAEATARGDVSGWQRLTDEETEEWSTNFVAYNGGSVDAVSWRREQAGGTELLSYWIAVGPNGHRACAYSTREPAGLLDALSERLGAPDSIEENDAIETVSAWWAHGEREYSFTQSGSAASINILLSR